MNREKEVAARLNEIHERLVDEIGVSPRDPDCLFLSNLARSPQEIPTDCQQLRLTATIKPEEPPEVKDQFGRLVFGVKEVSSFVDQNTGKQRLQLIL